MSGDQEVAISARLYTTKQMGDACEMLIAGELTLAGVPAIKAPDYWPGYDVMAERDGKLERVSVKSRTFKAGPADFVTYKRQDVFDWLAIVILPDNVDQQRRYYIVPRSVCDLRFRGYLTKGEPVYREMRLDMVAEKLSEYRDNFRLQVFDT